MIISVLLLTPLLLSVFLVLIKSKMLNRYGIIVYSLMYFIGSISLCVKPQGFDPYFRVDSLNIVFLLVLAFVYLGVSFYVFSFLKHADVSVKWHTYYSASFLLFVFSMTGVILSSHLGLLWVFVEATTLSSAILIYFEKSKSALEAVWKYIFICSIGIALAFVGIILLSIGTGTLNSLFFEDLYKHAGLIDPFWLKLAFVFILVGLGTKMGLAPVHAWLPDAHSEAPSGVSAMLSGTLLNAAFLGILRVFKIMELANIDYYPKVLLIIMGFLSLFVSVVFIIKAKNYKRMLAYSSIENMGIVALGVGIGGVGLFAAMLHMVAHSFTKAAFFLTSGNILHRFKTKEISKVGGVLIKDPVTGWLWILCFIGIAGLPPFPMFLSEFLMVKAIFQQGHIFLMILFFILLTIIIYGIGSSVFSMSFGREMDNISNKRFGVLEYMPQILFLIILFVLGIFMPDSIMNLLKAAAENI
jgi:hydrogenase-4 component F